MGLDMYLSARLHISGYDNSKKLVRDTLLALIEVTPSPHDPSITIEYTVLYWRKANAIHKWFVDHTQDGEDRNGVKTRVEREQLIELRDLCRKVLATTKTAPGTITTGMTYTAAGMTKNTTLGQVITNPEEVAALLPTQPGFFFGSTDYDEYYLDDVKETAEELDRILANPALEDSDFFYQSSW